MKPIALYLHFPWCVQKCPYCDFNSHQAADNFKEDDYIQALFDDITQSKILDNRIISSIFLGGGTPSLFSGKAINTLLKGLSDSLVIPENIEITMEANPNSLSIKKLINYRQSGINRLSIGAQSFNNTHLKTLGRVHNYDEIIQSYNNARLAGFKNINLDIMFGLPYQNLSSALSDLRQAIKLNPEHLSWYQLTIEPNTKFFQQPPSCIPEHDELFDIQNYGIELLAENGFSRYEVSAFSRNRPCEHNLNYWQFGDYLGIGAGAHGKITECDVVFRTTKHRNPKNYLTSNDKLNSRQIIPKKDISFEFMLNALRLKQGFSFELYEQQTSLKISGISKIIEQAIQNNWLERTDTGVKPTKLGFNFLNDLLALFLD